jgi:polyhydroxybutyrate depolymerase
VLLTTTEGDLCIDLNRVYATGISLGAAVSADLGCTLTDQIASVGLVAVEVPFEPCKRRLPVIAFHGTEDHVVPYKPGDVPAGQPNAELPGTQTNMARWASINGCNPTPTIENIKTEVVHATWPDCKDGSAVQLYTINGGGHTWPGSPIKVDYLGHTTDEIDATALILAFFEAHPYRAS